MKKQKSNSVVFPFKQFANLDDLTLHDSFVLDLEMGGEALRDMLAPNQLEEVTPKGSSVEERILSIFLDAQVRFGASDLITADRTEWIARLKHFTKAKKPILFTILGFPGKAPAPLKTNRTLPDMGEVLALRRLRDIVLCIKRIYTPGAHIVIVTEGGLGAFIGLPEAETTRYEQQLSRLATLLGWEKHFTFVPIGTLRENKNFDVFFKEERAKITRAYKDGDASMREKFALAYPSIFHLMNVRRSPLSVVAEVYKGKPTSVKAVALGKQLAQKTEKAIVDYLAFLAVRDRTQFLSSIAPNALPLTVSPKRGRLGIHLINAKTDILAHHGVVWDGKTTYLIDVRRSKKPIARVFLKEDGEHVPFFYLTLNN